MDLKEVSAVDPFTHWYYRSKVAVVETAIRRYGPTSARIVDIGAGSGFFSIWLTRHFPGATALCVDTNYSTERAENGERVRFAMQASSNDLSEADLVLLMDVLEHVDDDRQLLEKLVIDASPGTLFVVTVPAFMSLWSGHDDYLEHRRRYRLGEVVKLAKFTGLEVLEARYLFGSIFPLVWMARRFARPKSPSSDLRPTHPLVNFLLTQILKLEHSTKLNKFAGVSVLVIAMKPVAPSQSSPCSCG